MYSLIQTTESSLIEWKKKRQIKVFFDVDGNHNNNNEIRNFK